MTLKRPFCTCKPSVNLAYAAGALVSVSSARAGRTGHTMRAHTKKMNGTNRFILHPSRFTERKKERGAPLWRTRVFPAVVARACRPHTRAAAAGIKLSRMLLWLGHRPRVDVDVELFADDAHDVLVTLMHGTVEANGISEHSKSTVAIALARNANHCRIFPHIKWDNHAPSARPRACAYDSRGVIFVTRLRRSPETRYW